MRKGQYIDISGERFGRLVAIERVGAIGSRSIWRCTCDCGNECVANISNLRNGTTQSCGCYKRERIVETKTKHGGDRKNGAERLYRVWKSMRQRCYLKSGKHYLDYGGRGITVCEEWQDYSSFKDWAYKNGYDPLAKRGVTTIERIDNNGNYEPSNCRWTDMKQQAQNRRKRTDYSCLYKPVVKIDDTGNIVSIYESMKSAATDVGLKSTTPIKLAIDGKRKKAKGFYWAYGKGI